jgi:hypothetical protein
MFVPFALPEKSCFKIDKNNFPLADFLFYKQVLINPFTTIEQKILELIVFPSLMVSFSSPKKTHKMPLDDLTV